MRRASPGVVLVIALACSAMAGAAKVSAAHPDPLGRAEALFQRGKERLAADDYANACPLLAESFQLDPATGSLLALALCHERQGKLASALREYNMVVTRSRSEGRPDRAQAALARAAALHTEVSSLTLRTQAHAGDLIVHVNGVRILPQQLGQPMPLDGGEVLVEVESPHKSAWQKRVSLAQSGEKLTLAIPVLEASASSPEVLAKRQPAASVPPRVPVPSQHAASRLTGAQWTGIALLAAGVAGAGVAVGFTLHAIRKNEASEAGCMDDVCTPSGRRDRLDARAAGNVATISAAGALAFSAAGLITYLTGRRRRDLKRPDSVAVRASSWLVPHGGGATISGRF